MLKKDLAWIFSDGESINFWHEICCNMSPIIQYIRIFATNNINLQAKVSDFISPHKTWNLDTLTNILPLHVTIFISRIPIPATNVQDKLTWNFSKNGLFTV